MIIIGLTGGIASGKSTVVKMILERGIPTIDADIIAREIVEPGKPALIEIKDSFGDGVINSDGTLNRVYLGNIVFSNKEKLKKLNDITHGRIINEIENRIDMYREKTNVPVIFIDAALLLEMDMTKLVNEVWLVATGEDLQLERLINRDQLSWEDAKKRISSQMSTEEKKKYADVVIDNNQNIEYLEKQIDYHLKRVIYQISGGI